MSGRDVKPRLPRMPGPRAASRQKATLIAAAESHPEDEATTSSTAAAEPSAAPTAPARASRTTPARRAGANTDSSAAAPTQTDAMDVDEPASAPAPAAVPARVQPRSAGGSDRSGTVTPVAGGTPTATPAASGSAGLPKMKFKPKMPVRRAPQEDVKPEIPSPAATRGRPAMRARGRGGASRGGRSQASNQTIAAGPFGGSRANSSRRLVAPPAPPRYQPDLTSVEVYSDNEDGTRTGVIDMEAVSTLSESAPTSVYRDRDLDGGKAKAKEMEKAKLKQLKKRRKAEKAARAGMMNAAGASVGAGAHPDVKPEPVSPLISGSILPDPNAGVPPPLTRVGDEMIPADEQQDRDAEGRRLRALTSGTEGTPESEEVNTAHAIDLSESESEDEEDDMEGDFVFVEGNDNPEDKLFTFQFPSNMPRFVVPAPPPDADGDIPMDAELKPEIKPSPAALKKRRQSNAPPPEGRIGTLCVMKSGKVKLVMGEGANAIVMNVQPGVPTTFVEQLVHLDGKNKSTTILGEVHKQYTATPDLDRLLEELFINGGETPGDRERRQAEIERRNRMERGLVKMEMSSP